MKDRQDDPEATRALGVEVGRETLIAVGPRPMTPDAIAYAVEVADRAIARGKRLRGWTVDLRVDVSVPAGPLQPLRGRPFFAIAESSDAGEDVLRAFVDGFMEGWKDASPSPFAGLFGVL